MAFAWRSGPWRANVPLQQICGQKRSSHKSKQHDQGISMAHYVDGFVIPIPKENLDDYRRGAQKAGKIWRDHGALEFRECAGDDLNTKMGMPFPRGIKTKPGETGLFSYIVFKSRVHRDSVNAKVMKDPRLAKLMKSPMLRCEAHALRRIQDHRRSLSS